ncbi:MAG: hypothetical protein ACTIJ9_16755 [Aequorivita sp.]
MNCEAPNEIGLRKVLVPPNFNPEFMFFYSLAKEIKNNNEKIQYEIAKNYNQFRLRINKIYEFNKYKCIGSEIGNVFESFSGFYPNQNYLQKNNRKIL